MPRMKATSTPQAGRDLAVTATLAQLLERLEHSPTPIGAEQYRSVVLHLVHEFEDVAGHRAACFHPIIADIEEPS